MLEDGPFTLLRLKRPTAHISHLPAAAAAKEERSQGGREEKSLACLSPLSFHPNGSIGTPTGFHSFVKKWRNAKNSWLLTFALVVVGFRLFLSRRESRPPLGKQ